MLSSQKVGSIPLILLFSHDMLSEIIKNAMPDE